MYHNYTLLSWDVPQLQSFSMELIKNEMEFYSKFTRPLIFALPDATDRILASAWVVKIKEEASGPEKLRTEYMKLLLFAMQRKKLVGIFTDDPSNYETLSEFPEGYDLNLMAKLLIEKEQKDRINNIRDQLSGVGDFTPYTTDFSSDLREYVAAQDIPGFGVHCYYAISKNPITTWNNADKVIIPKGARGVLSATISEVAVKDVEVASKAGKSLTDVSEEDAQKKSKKRKLSHGPLIRPLGVPPPKTAEEERRPPTWSSNLINVKETPMRDVFLRQPTDSILKPHIVHTQVQFKEDDELTEIEGAIDDFERGGIKVRKPRGADGVPMTETDVYDQMVDQSTAMDDFDDTFLDLDRSQYDDDVNQDAFLVKYIRDTVDSKSAEKDRQKTKAEILGSLPAQAGIPVTTPRPSVSPRRQLSTERLFSIAQRKLSEDELMETTIPEKDPDMLKLFLDASAIEDTSFPDDMDFDFEDEPDAYMFDKQMGKEVREPMPRPTMGSPAGNAIISEVVPALQKAHSPPRFPLQEQEELPLEQEMLYIDYLWKDKETNEMMKRIAHTVRDVEQDFPDPVNLLIPSLPFQDVGPMPFLSEETMEFPPSPEKLPSPPRHPVPQALTAVVVSPKVCGATKPSPQQQLIEEITAEDELPQLQVPTPPRQTAQTSTGPMFFPSIPSEYRQWPSSPDEDLAESVRKHEINEQYLDRDRPAMQKRIVVGKTAGKSKKLPRRFIPTTLPIREHEDEGLYGAVLQRTPPESPEPFADDDTMLEFAKGYAPPVYESPPGIFFESPPQLDSADYRRTTGPTDTRHRDLIDQRKEHTEHLISDLHRTLEKLEGFQQSLIQRPQTPVQQPKSKPAIRRRRLDFDDTTLDTDTFLANAMARYPDLPPLPPEEMPTSVLTPLKTGQVEIPGWESPVRPQRTIRHPQTIRPQPTTPPFYHMPFTSQMLDTGEAPFEGVEFSPPRDLEYEDFYAQHGASQFVERMQPPVERISPEHHAVPFQPPQMFHWDESSLQTPPRRAQTSPRMAQTPPRRIQTPPRMVQTPPRRVQTSPSGVQTSPSGIEFPVGGYVPPQFPARVIQPQRRGDAYFKHMAGNAVEDVDLFGMEMEFPPSPTGSPADRTWFEPAPMPPGMQQRMQRLQETAAPIRTVTGTELPFETPLRRHVPLQRRIITPDAEDYGFPPMATYSPLTRVEVPCELPTNTRTLDSYRRQDLYDKPCCRYHQQLRENL